MPGDEVWIGRHRFTIHYELSATEPPPQTQRAPDMFKQSLLEKAGLEKDASPSPKAGRSPRRSRAESFGDLIPCGGGSPITLMQQRLTIGRHRKCDIVLRFETVSSRHCELELVDDYWMVRDLGSRNGTRVDGKRVQENLLVPGSILWVHKYRFEVDYKPRSNRPPPSETNVSMTRSLLEKAGLSRRKE